MEMIVLPDDIMEHVTKRIFWNRSDPKFSQLGDEWEDDRPTTAGGDINSTPVRRRRQQRSNDPGGCFQLALRHVFRTEIWLPNVRHRLASSASTQLP